ncbi:MAG: SDR family NAD(P)-dependent oxidoreductase [Chloroflexi bacterium]|nr:SDR family NAD(P)-dependent oxidoreductase [Chloroflexota bacterium]
MTGSGAARVALIAAAGIGLGVLQRRLRGRGEEPSNRFADEVVVITGSSRGLGLLLARQLAREGARLVLCARNERQLELARREIADVGAQVLAVPCDVSDQAQVDTLVRRALDRFGRIDMLVNNAGAITVGPIETQTVADFEEAMGVMFWGVLFPTLAVLPHMQARRSGRIVNVTSIGGRVSVPHLVPYNCAKFAAVGLSEGLRAELSKDGLSVVTVVPGLMRTGSHVNATFKSKHEAEYTWFSLGAAVPVASMSGERAARQILDAAWRGDADVILSLPAQLAVRFHGLFPGVTAEILGLVNRVLPGPGGIGTARRLGRESETSVTSSFVTALGRQAAYANNQYSNGAGH